MTFEEISKTFVIRIYKKKQKKYLYNGEATSGFARKNISFPYVNQSFLKFFV